MQVVPQPEIEEISPFEFRGRIYYGSATQYWIQTGQGTEVSCGANGSIEITASKGISKEDEYLLKQYLEASLGVKEIAGFKSGLEVQSKRKITWSNASTITLKREIKAPECGSAVYELYRKYIRYNLKTTRKRFIRKDIEVDLPPIHEDTGMYIARIISESDHPYCPCDKKERSGVPVRIDMVFGEKLRAIVDGFLNWNNMLSFEIEGNEYSIKIISEDKALNDVTLDPAPNIFNVLLNRGQNPIENVSISVELDQDITGVISAFLSENRSEPMTR